jgi:hypothetical protein
MFTYKNIFGIMWFVVIVSDVRFFVIMFVVKYMFFKSSSEICWYMKWLFKVYQQFI